MNKKKVGIEYIGDLKSCNKQILHNLSVKKLRIIVSGLLKKNELKELGAFYHQFDVGLTCVVALAESHLAIHTWPVEGYVSMNVFICNFEKNNEQVAKVIFDELIQFFESKNNKITKISRRF